ncbi:MULTISPECIES: LytTR family DNA-binding domain-containing protein [unclassified Imperialibacter]|uniref:LytR/AlgR family response regulator transcription factor n=1 Tax=unclassified Imperialibacter TaxID=2629706 RepID=UPI001252994E|nr:MULTISPECIES: LytTR family DNA-binding domain-containing protein [unclassified Imperialibacter]CAD5282517.1 DNA-binding response regulator [Imperialibacter sp. 89]CAD5287107.1 DNA-binding response regulator [Imperialibacter sp. 75]VVT30412.1 DNA-binding response regulator [Imperialibacter sp. EC-SDR9]
MSTVPKIRCIIVDDEELARALIKEYVSKIPSLELVGTYKNPLEALGVLRAEQIDLMFLDIQMPELTGIQFLKSLEKKPVVIFTTAYPEYALEGYELDVVDYLVKPVSIERFLHGVNKATKILHNKTDNSGTTNQPDFIVVHADHKIYRLLLADILYIEGLREYVSYFTSDGKRIIALESLKKLEEILPPNMFMRVHKSYIVPINRVRVIEGNMVMVEKKGIPIGASYKEATLKALMPG